MAALRLHYEDGYFIPLEGVPDLPNGDEIEVQWTPMPTPADIEGMLDRTVGLWADLEEFSTESRLKDIFPGV